MLELNAWWEDGPLKAKAVCVKPGLTKLNEACCSEPPSMLDGCTPFGGGSALAQDSSNSSSSGGSRVQLWNDFGRKIEMWRGTCSANRGNRLLASNELSFSALILFCAIFYERFRNNFAWCWYWENWVSELLHCKRKRVCKPDQCCIARRT